MVFRIQVTTSADVISDADGQTSLREAIQFAESAGRPTLITFDPTVFGVFTAPGGGTVRANTVEITERLTIASGTDVVIDGQLANGVDIRLVGNGDRLFDIADKADVVIRDMEMTRGVAVGAPGRDGSLEVDRPQAGVEADSNNGEDGADGADSEFGGSVGDLAVAGILNLGNLTLERVVFNGLTALAADGGQGGDGANGGNGGNGALVQAEPTGELVFAGRPNAFAYDNFSPVIVPSEEPGDGGDGGNGGDGSDGGGGGTAVGAIQNAGSLILRDVQFENIAAEAGNGGNGGVGGRGGEGGEQSPVVDPGWIINVTRTDGPLGGFAELLDIEPTLENYEGIRLGPDPTDFSDSGLFRRPGLVDFNPDAEGPDRYTIAAHSTQNMGDGGSAGNGGDGGDGGDAVAAVRNLGSVAVQGAQSQVTASFLKAGLAGAGGTSLAPGSPGSWSDPRLFGRRDVEFEWGDRPYFWNDSNILGSVRSGSVGELGVKGVGGTAGTATDFLGTTIDTFASTFFVEALSDVVTEGGTVGFQFTRAGEFFSGARISYQITLGAGLEQSDFATPVNLTGDVDFSSGQTSALVFLPATLVDGLDEGVEQLTLRIEGSPTASIGFSDSATVQIADTGAAALVLGTERSDTLFVEDGTALGLGDDDRIFGGSGDETLDGGEGRDLLRGGGGDDTLIGGGGGDIFSIIDQFGDDTVPDFDPTVDRIESDLDFSAFTVAQVGADVRITVTAPDGPTPGSLTLRNTSAADVTSAVFTRIDLAPLPDPGGTPGALSASDDRFATNGEVIAGNVFDDNGSGADQPGDGGTLRLVSATAEGTALTLGAATTLPSGAQIIVRADGTFEYDPSGAFAGTTGSDTFTYVATGSAASGELPSAFEAVVDLTSIAPSDGVLGFVAVGAEQDDLAGSSVSSAGDINNDGIEDIFLSSLGENVFATFDRPGTAYLIYGSDTGFDLTDGQFDLGSLDFGDGSLGLVFEGLPLGRPRVTAITSGGDLNGDGIDDLALAIDNRDDRNFGQVVVIYGAETRPTGTLLLDSLSPSEGFIFDPGETATSLDIGGDVNGDEVDDLVIGTPDFIGFGAAWVIYGADGGVATDGSAITDDTIRDGDGTLGYAIVGSQSGDLMGSEVAISDDINGDGTDDLLVGAPGANISSTSQGRVFALFGNGDQFGLSDPDIRVQTELTLDGTQGFSVDASKFFDQPANNLNPLGDINGDGLADFIVGGGDEDDAFVVLGSADGFPITDGRLTLDSLRAGAVDGAFRIQMPDDLGSIVASGNSDVNGDGLNDILIYNSQTFDAFVIFGQDSGFDLTNGTFDLGSLATGDGSTGFVLSAPDGTQFRGGFDPFTGEIGGDVNGDGVADIVLSDPFADANGAFSGLTYVVYGRGGSGSGPTLETVSATATINVGLPTLPIDAPQSFFTVLEDGTLSQSLGMGGVFALADAASSGTVNLGAGGAFTYVPNADFNGSDAFSYTIDGTTTGTVSISVVAQNDAPVAVDDVVTTDERTEVRINVLANDTDVDGGTPTLVSVSDPVRGSATVDGGQVVYDPGEVLLGLRAGETATETLTVTVTDGALTSTSTLSITIEGVDDLPRAVADVATVTEGVAQTIDVLANDVSGDVGPLSLVSVSSLLAVSAPSDGFAVPPVEIVGGALVYTPAPGYTGGDTITYVATDGETDVTGELLVTVLDNARAPVAEPDIGATDEDTAILLDVIGNDNDPDMDALRFGAVELIGGGTVSVPDGDLPDLLFDPGSDFQSLGADESEMVEVIYTVTDGALFGGSSVMISVAGRNDAPTGVTVSSTRVDENSGAGTEVGTVSVLDVDASDSHTLDLLSDGGGTFVLDGTSLLVAPGQALDFEATSSFEIAIRATDAAGASVESELIILLNDVEESFVGTAADNTIVGDAAPNRMEGLAGADILRGELGNDTMFGGFGADRMNGGAGNDILAGQGQADTIAGGDGNDFLNGGFGFDRVTGNAGLDRFFHLGVEGHGTDWIVDYNSAEGDVLIFGDTSATTDEFQVNFAHTENPGIGRLGDDSVEEAFVIYKPTGQIIWALVDGAGADEILFRTIGADLTTDLPL